MSTRVSFTVDQVSQKMGAMPPSPKSGGATSCDYVMYTCSYDRVKPGIKSNLVHQQVILENWASLYCCDIHQLSPAVCV